MKNWKKNLALLLSVVMIVGMLAACNNNGGDTTPSPSASVEPSGDVTPDTPSTPVAADIRINLASEPPEMNSALTTSTGSMSALRHMVDGLVRLDQTDSPYPGIAESWEIDSETNTYVFKLRDNAVWSNGTPVTAYDFEYAWTQHFTPEVAAAYAGTWAPLIVGASEMLEGNAIDADTAALLADLGYTGNVGFMAVDDYTFKVTTTGPYPYFLALMAFPSFLPINQDFAEQVGWDNYGKEAAQVLSNGAYTLTEWVHEDSMVFTKNENYYDAENIKLNSITMAMIADTGTALNSYLAGDIDMIGLNGDQSNQLKNDGYTIYTYDDGSCWYFEFNVTQPGLNNVKVREALTNGIDAQSFITNVVKNNSKVAYNFCPPAINNGEFSATVGTTIERVTDGDYSAYKTMLEEGLAEEGLSLDTFKLTMLTDEGDTAAKNCAFFQEQWKVNLGVEMEVIQMTYKERIARMQAHDFSVVMAGWGPDYNDPMTFLDLFVTGNGNNHTGYSNPRYDELVSLAMAESDEAVREGYLVELDNIITTDYMVGPIYNRARDYVTSDRLHGVLRTAFQDINLLFCYVEE